LSGSDPAARAAHQATRELKLLLDDAPDLAALLPRDYLAAVERYVALLLAANERLNLTRVVEPAGVARLHLLDALAALPLLDALDPRDVIDIGSGGGVPAVPLALARPDVHWTLVDSVGKKATVLAAMAESLGLRNVTVLADRAETLGHDSGHRERYDLATARACAPLPVLAELALPLVRIGGTLLAWKGPLDDEGDELRRGRTAVGEMGGGAVRREDPRLPALGDHQFVTATKERATPDRFPRRPGEPARRPLG